LCYGFGTSTGFVRNRDIPSPDFVLGGGRRGGRWSSLVKFLTDPDVVRAGGRLCSAAPLDLERPGGVRVESRMANNISLDFWRLAIFLVRISSLSLGGLSSSPPSRLH
jgi:hypothetical protein